MQILEGVKCIVKGCSNRKDTGHFKGDLCVACYNYLVTGIIGPTDSFLGKLRPAVDDQLQDKVHHV